MKIRIVMSATLVALLVSLVSVQQGFGQEKKMHEGMAMEKSLYQRLGGYDAIAAVVDDFLGRLLADKALTRFFGGASVDSQKRLRQHLVNQVCAVTGGPCYYLGRDMKTVHTGLGITEADWQAGVNDLVASLDHFKVPQKEKDELIGIIATTKKDIVEKP
jgi:hemoglobin